MRILLTGATGFIGSAILRQLIQRGHNVRVLIRPNSNKKNLLGLDCEIFLGDLNDMSSIEPAIKKCQVLMHVAADYRLWALNPEELTTTNVDGTKNIMTAAINANVKKIIYTSSVATLGKNRNNMPANEDTPSSLSDMIGVYKKSKFLAGNDYTIADMATFPWIARHEWHDIGLKKYDNLKRWYLEISKREAVQKGYDFLNKGEAIPKI